MNSETVRDRLAYLYLSRMMMDPVGPGVGPGGDLSAILNQSFNEVEDIKKPTSKSFIDNLKVHIVTGEEAKAEIMCSICQDTLKEGTKSYKLPCPDNAHYFCIGDNPEECDGILPWLEENNTCPICRHELPLEPEKVAAPSSPSGVTGPTHQPSLPSQTSILNRSFQLQFTEPVYEDDDEHVGDIEDNPLDILSHAASMMSQAPTPEPRPRRQVIGHRIRRRNIELYDLIPSNYIPYNINMIAPPTAAAATPVTPVAGTIPEGYTPEPVGAPLDTTIPGSAGADAVVVVEDAADAADATARVTTSEPEPETGPGFRRTPEEIAELIPDVISHTNTVNTNNLNRLREVNARLTMYNRDINEINRSQIAYRNYLLERLRLQEEENENQHYDNDGYSDMDMDAAIRMSLQENDATATTTEAEPEPVADIVSEDEITSEDKDKEEVEEKE
jgi:hypothetical protein